MSTAILKFRHEALDPAILAATLDALPYPVAVAENETVIYSNASFAQAKSESTKGPQLSAANQAWKHVQFSALGRAFVLTTATAPSASLEADAEHALIVGRLVTGVAHDFNNLLTGILLYCDLMQSTLPVSNPLWRRTHEIRAAAEQGTALIRQLMNVGREHGHERKEVCFNDVVRELESLLRHLLGEQIRITLQLAPDAGLVGITWAQAQQIILNLVINARDAMPNGGELLLETRLCADGSRRDRMLQFSVTDNGHGMDAATAARAFDFFFTTKRPGKGTGTGLATVKSVVDTAGGTVHVKSASGKGTRMIVHLPEVQAACEQAATVQERKQQHLDEHLRGANQ